jgi:hypothetical protein
MQQKNPRWPGRRPVRARSEWAGGDQQAPTRRTPYHRGVERFNPAPPIFLEDLVEFVAEKYDVWKDKANCHTYNKRKYVASKSNTVDLQFIY